MAEVGGNCESKETAKVSSKGSVHQQISDAGLYSLSALCALSLRRQFQEEWNSDFNKQTLTMILNGLEQPKQVQEAIHALYSGAGQDDMSPFVDMLLEEPALQGDASPVISQLITFAVSQGNYDARMRELIKHIAWRLHIGWDHMQDIECELAQHILSQKYEMSDEEKAEQEKKAKYRKYKRFALIGLATVTGGTLIGLTGGLAAPLVAVGAGAIIGGAGAAALGSVAGVAIIGSLFGVAGAGLTGYKMKKRMGAIEEFEFEPLSSGGALHLQTVRNQLHITIAVTGWIDNRMSDFKKPWQNLRESHEQYSLRWESQYLRELGQAFDYIFNTAVSMATKEALKHTVLAALLAAITWPATLLSVSKVIDNPWSVALQRAVATGRQLAEVLLSREQGKRPVTLIGYSLGGRVIFYCLEEMAKRKGCEGIVQDVVMLGTPVTSDPKAWAALQRVVAGRIINGYCRGDWLLKFLYRTASIQFRIAGLSAVNWTNNRMHNMDLSDVVSGHLDYMNQLDTILRVVGIRVHQEVKARVKARGLKPSSSSGEVTSGESSPVDLSGGLVSSELDSSGEKLSFVNSEALLVEGVSSDQKTDSETTPASDEETASQPASRKRGEDDDINKIQSKVDTLELTVKSSSGDEVQNDAGKTGGDVAGPAWNAVIVAGTSENDGKPHSHKMENIDENPDSGKRVVETTSPQLKTEDARNMEEMQQAENRRESESKYHTQTEIANNKQPSISEEAVMKLQEEKK